MEPFGQERDQHFGLDAGEVGIGLPVSEDRQLRDAVDLARIGQVDEVVIPSRERRNAPSERAVLAAHADVDVARRLRGQSRVADLHDVGCQVRPLGIELLGDG